MINEDILIEIGLTGNESKIYLSLLEIGLTTVTNISERTKMHRTNVYDSLKKLMDKGLVSFMKQDNITFYEASDPNTLLGLVREKEDKLKKIIPQLLLSKKLAENTGEALLIKGASSFIETLFELLNYQQEILVFGMPERAIKLLGARIFPFHKERLQRKIILKQIYSEELKRHIKNKNDEITTTKFNKQNVDYGISSIICGSEVLITEWTTEVMTLRIKNEMVAKHYMTQFSMMWDNS